MHPPNLHPTLGNKDLIDDLPVFILVAIDVVILCEFTHYEATINLVGDVSLIGADFYGTRCFHRVHHRYVSITSDFVRCRALFNPFLPYLFLCFLLSNRCFLSAATIYSRNDCHGGALYLLGVFFPTTGSWRWYVQSIPYGTDLISSLHPPKHILIPSFAFLFYVTTGFY